MSCCAKISNRILQLEEELEHTKPFDNLGRDCKKILNYRLKVITNEIKTVDDLFDIDDNELSYDHKEAVAEEFDWLFLPEVCSRKDNPFLKRNVCYNKNIDCIFFEILEEDD